MTTTATNHSIQTIAVEQRVVAGIIMLAIGLVMLVGVGFAHSETIHNAAHDTRHSIGFPCH